MTTPNVQNFEDGDSDEEDFPPGWHIVRTEDNLEYFWNEETGETSWDPPTIRSTTNKADSPLRSPLPNENITLTNRIEIVPEELIRKEGPFSYKAKKDFGGIEPKKQHSWHSAWAVVCVGYFIMYKDDPAKLKKKEKVILPIQVLTLEQIVIKKEAKDAGRKNLISIQSRSGAVYLLQPQNENDVNDWISTITDCTKENSTVAEVENGNVCLYSA
jgi:hypothetical protein